MFALDVFDGRHSFWETILALLMHLIPVFVLILVLVIAWRREVGRRGAVSRRGRTVVHHLGFAKASGAA